MTTIRRLLSDARWRWGRLITGIAIMLAGAAIGDVRGFAVTILGFVPVVESLYDVNLVAPLLGLPLRARQIRVGGRLRARPVA